MNAKKIVTVMLLLFVAVAVGTMVMKGIGDPGETADGGGNTASPPGQATVPEQENAADQMDVAGLPAADIGCWIGCELARRTCG